jgi:hypothetical protein
VSAGKAFDTDQTITLAVVGTAASEDYSLSSSLTLHAGDTSVTATVTAVDCGRFGDGHHRGQRHAGLD